MVDSIRYGTNQLELALQEAHNKQGIIGKAWNGIKEITNLGQSYSDCESMLQKYKNKEISLDEAMNYIQEFENKQDTMTDLFENIATGALAIAAVGTGTIGIPMALAIGAPTGALAKTGIGLADRLTNGDSEDDFDAKEIAHDLVSGAITGTTSAVSSGVGKFIHGENPSLLKAAGQGVKASAACGAFSGAASYVSSCAIEDDKEFKFGDLVKNTATSAAVSGVVGGAVGAGLYGVAGARGTIGIADTSLVQDELSSATRKLGGCFVRNSIEKNA